MMRYMATGDDYEPGREPRVDAVFEGDIKSTP
jgi:hypothetical protein